MGTRAQSVHGRVDREQSAELARVVVQRGRQQVERVPAVGTLDGLEVRDVAVLEDLLTDPLVRHEPEVAPDVGLDELLLQHLDGELGAEHVGELGAGRGHHLEEVVAGAR